MSETEFEKGKKLYDEERYLEAFKWLDKAAKQGHAKAQFYLSVIYRNGLGGMPVNDDEAVKWIRKAAIQGYAEAQYNLSGMYYVGESVPKNYIYSYMWISLAKANGEERAQEKIEDLTKDMSSEEIAEALKLAQKCLESKYKDCPDDE